MKLDLERQINEYLLQKKQYGNAERLVRNLRRETFRPVIPMKKEAPVSKQEDDFCDKDYSGYGQEEDEDDGSDEESTAA
jgi:hypothetical protein